MYTVTSAARISHGWLDSDDWNARILHFDERALAAVRMQHAFRRIGLGQLAQVEAGGEVLALAGDDDSLDVVRVVGKERLDARLYNEYKSDARVGQHVRVDTARRTRRSIKRSRLDGHELNSIKYNSF